MAGLQLRILFVYSKVFLVLHQMGEYNDGNGLPNLSLGLCIHSSPQDSCSTRPN